MKGGVNPCGRLHCCLLLGNRHSHPILQQLSPWLVHSHHIKARPSTIIDSMWCAQPGLRKQGPVEVEEPSWPSSCVQLEVCIQRTYPEVWTVYWRISYLIIPTFWKLEISTKGFCSVKKIGCHKAYMLSFLVALLLPSLSRVHLVLLYQKRLCLQPPLKLLSVDINAFLGKITFFLSRMGSLGSSF